MMNLGHSFGLEFRKLGVGLGLTFLLLGERFLLLYFNDNDRHVTLAEPHTCIYIYCKVSEIRSHTVKNEHGGDRGCSVEMNDENPATNGERQTRLVGLDPAPLDIPK
jgi:hypothetical protein